MESKITMKTHKIIELIDQYSEKYRGPNLEKFEIGNQYFLFPNSEIQNKSGWPKKWQFCGNAGVYLFIDKNDEVIYVGETTHFGNRFGSYFSGKIDNLLKHNWSSKPHSVLQIKVPSESSFERLALEEYLIKKTNPLENKRFNYRGTKEISD